MCVQSQFFGYPRRNKQFSFRLPSENRPLYDHRLFIDHKGHNAEQWAIIHNIYGWGLVKGVTEEGRNYNEYFEYLFWCKNSSTLVCNARSQTLDTAAACIHSCVFDLNFPEWYGVTEVACVLLC